MESFRPVVIERNDFTCFHYIGLLGRFKILVLLSLYNLSDDAMEYQLNDRRTFQRFVGLEEKDTIPDAKTIWFWRETLTQSGSMEKLFHKFWKILEEEEIAVNSGSIVDATFADEPRQRNSRDENDQNKKGNIPEEWGKSENEAKIRQETDTEMRGD